MLEVTVNEMCLYQLILPLPDIGIGPTSQAESVERQFMS